MLFPKSSCFKLTTLSIFFLFSFSLFGKGFRVITIAEDTIVKMHGYIYDTISENPDKIGVPANIILESLPYGSEIGIINSKDSSGYYEYYINMANTYKIDIRSDKHSWYSENLDPHMVVQNGEIRRNYYLEPQVKENQVIRLNKLIFEQGKSNITIESYGVLNRLVGLMKENSSMHIQLEGHTDYRGSKKLNMELSQKRVDAVKAYLIGKTIKSKRIKTKAFGGTKPLVREQSIEASEINRRVEVRILKLK
ncbi:MAG: OmpA family protein [Cyclobacteriaceae bacterium]|nr:OmpA family protein [Cyclobacteriaceae bacterium]